MKRFLTLAALVLTTATSTAGPIRDRLAARFSRPAYPQPQQFPQPVGIPVFSEFEKPQQLTQPQPVQTVAAYQPAGFSPVVRTCSGGVCR